MTQLHYIQNNYLLSKWLFKLLTEGGTWHELLKNKYLANKTLKYDLRLDYSHFWTSLMGVKEQFIHCGNFVLNKGTQIIFSEDKWLGHTTLRDQYPILYNIVRKKT
jgi:hypothetical protein